MSSTHHNSHHSSGSNVVGVHYRVGKKIVSIYARWPKTTYSDNLFSWRLKGRGLIRCHFRRWVLERSRHGRCDEHKLTLCTFTGTNLLNSQTVAIKFEPRKSDAPQLRDEYRTYKILNGCREWTRYCLSSNSEQITDAFLYYSWSSTSILLWTGGIAQHSRHWSLRPQSGRPVWYVRTQIQHQDCRHDCQADGAW